MTATYKPLATVTLASSSPTVVFGSLPQSFRDLICVIRLETAFLKPTFRFNADSSAAYNYLVFGGGGAQAFGSALASQTSGFLSNYANADSARTQVVLQIMDYSTTDKHKTTLSRSFYSYANTEIWTNRWANTSAITSITFSSAGFPAGSTFNLYGVNS